jgi:iron complex outermembrane receptor protein
MQLRLKASTALVSLLFATPIYAQSNSAGQPNAEDGTNKGGLSEIVVTAQRRVETAQKAAIAIDVASPEELTRAGVATPTGLNSVAPSLFIARGGGANTSFFIRGVGNFTNNAYSDPAVAFNLDGVYLGRPTSTTGTFYDLQRIEVLKGPQGTLYGRNATGGAINVITQSPKLGEFSGYASGSYGNYNSVDVEGAINLPIGQKTAVRLSGKVVSQDGFNQDGTDDNKGEAVRAQLLTEFSDGLSLRIMGDYSHTGGVGPGPSYLGTVAFAPGAPASATAPVNYVFSPAPAALGDRPGFHTAAANAYHSTFVIGGAFINPGRLDAPHIDGQNYGVSAEFKADLGGVDLVVVPAYREFKLNQLFNGPAFKGGINREKNSQFSVEARLSGTVGPVDWLLGGYHFDESTLSATSYNQYFVQSIQNFTTGTNSNAAFGRLTFHVSDAFRLVGAARYTQDKKNFDGSVDTVIDVCTNAPPPFGTGCFGGASMPTGTSLASVAAQIPAALLPFGFPTAPGPANARPFGATGNILFYAPMVMSRGLKNNRVTYRAAAEYDVGPNSLLYASYETGYHSGGFSPSVGNETYAPEYISAITLGSKNRFMDNRLQLNIEAFYWRYRDQQVSHFGLDANGGNSYFTENIGRSDIKGVDLDIQFKATPTTLLTGSVQYLDSQLKDFVYTAPRGGTALPPVVGCPYSNGTAGANLVYLINCSGKPGFNAPKWSLNGGLEQRFELGDYEVIFNGSARYRSNRVLGFEYLVQQDSGSDVTLDASLAFGPADGKWELTAWVRNLTDKQVASTNYYSGTSGSVFTSSYLPPRTYGVRARMNF